MRRCCRPWGCGGRQLCAGEKPIRKYLAAHEAASDVASGLGGMSKVFRAILQSLILAVGGISRHQSGIDGGHHHREFDPDGARACPGGNGNRKLERLCQRPASRVSGWINC